MWQQQLKRDHGVLWPFLCSSRDGPQFGSQAEAQSKYAAVCNPVESVIRVTLLGLFGTFVCG